MDRNLIFLDSNSLLENVLELIQFDKSKMMLVLENNEVADTFDIENPMEFILIKEVKINTVLNEK